MPESQRTERVPPGSAHILLPMLQAASPGLSPAQPGGTGGRFVLGPQRARVLCREPELLWREPGGAGGSPQPPLAPPAAATSKIRTKMALEAAPPSH